MSKKQSNPEPPFRLSHSELCGMARANESEGIKFDVGKPRFSLLPPDVMEEVLKVFMFGAAQYGDRNWEKGMSWSRNFDAANRHLWQWFRGERCASDSQIHHLAHAIVDIMFILAYELRQVGTDDRPKLRQISDMDISGG